MDDKKRTPTGYLILAAKLAVAGVLFVVLANGMDAAALVNVASVLAFVAWIGAGCCLVIGLVAKAIEVGRRT